MENLLIVKYLKYCVGAFIPVAVLGYLLGGLVWSGFGFVSSIPFVCIVFLVVMYVRNIVKHGVNTR